jgi:hypothetical protein
MQKRNAKMQCENAMQKMQCKNALFSRTCKCDTLMTGVSATKKKPSTRHHVVAEEVANGHVGLSVDVVDWIG